MAKSKISSRLSFLFIIIIVIGIWVRFTNIDGKVYWKDEAYTSLWLSGYAPSEVRKKITGNILRVEDLQQYQHIDPNKGVFDTVKLLAENDPQHPPLWYLLTRLWIGTVGDSIANIRFVSVFISLLALPLTYWLCLELFDSSRTGLIGTLIVAISPFHILYAQEAREYSLWTVTILLSSAVMLRAIRRKTIEGWGIYALTVSLGLYSYFLNLLVIFSHGVYVFTLEKFKFRKITISFLVSSFVGILTFLPWLVYVDRIDAAGWTSREIPFIPLVKIWILNLGRIFMDIDFDLGNPLTYLLLPLLVLVAYSIYFLCTNASKSSWLFLLILIGTTTLPLLLPDLFIGGRRSLIARFLTPLYLGIQISIAYLIASKINFNYINKQQLNLWNIVLAIIVSIGIFSGFRISKTNYSWNKYDGEDFLPIAQILNSSPNALLIGYPGEVVQLLSLSHLLKSNIGIQIVSEYDSLNISDEFSNFFIINAPEDFKYKIQQVQAYNINPVYQGRYQRLWKIEK